MLPPGTGFIIAYILSPPELVESEREFIVDINKMMQTKGQLSLRNAYLQTKVKIDRIKHEFMPNWMIKYFTKISKHQEKTMNSPIVNACKWLVITFRTFTSKT